MLQASEWEERNCPEIQSAARVFLMDSCWHCSKKLKQVGHSCLNRADHEDWHGPILHKKCWKDLKDDKVDG